MEHIQIGIDIGGTFSRSAVSDGAAKAGMPAAGFKKTPMIWSGAAKREVEENLCRIIDGYWRDYPIDRIGLSLAAAVNRETGVIQAWPNHPSWVGFNIRAFLQNKYQVPVFIEDDANCGAIGEYYFGNQKSSSLIYISIGTGIGCGIIINGRIYHGEHGHAGELGHIICTDLNSFCSCGQQGCLQAAASGSGIISRYMKMTGKKETDVRRILAKAKAKRMPEAGLIKAVMNDLSIGIYNLVMLFDIRMSSLEVV